MLPNVEGEHVSRGSGDFQHIESRLGSAGPALGRKRSELPRPIAGCRTGEPAKVSRLGLATLVGLAVSLTGCGSSAEVRYKVIVEIDDNGVARSGSSVWSFALAKPTVALASPYDAKFKGEAVEVDLGAGRTLYALLVGEDGDKGTVQLWPEHLFKDLSSARSDRIKLLRDIASNEGEERVLPRWGERISDSRDPMIEYPLLVRFRDRNDPTTVEAVDPDALDRSFGPGVALKAIKVQVTEEPVRTGIKARLQWLEPVGRERSTLIPDPPRLLKDAAPIQRVSPSAFSTELYK
ncbi:MAG TPA: hypothetical protein VF535_00865 [Allosphingosinicella sp.]